MRSQVEEFNLKIVKNLSTRSKLCRNSNNSRLWNIFEGCLDFPRVEILIKKDLLRLGSHASVCNLFLWHWSYMFLTFLSCCIKNTYNKSASKIAPSLIYLTYIVLFYVRWNWIIWRVALILSISAKAFFFNSSFDFDSGVSRHHRYL